MLLLAGDVQSNPGPGRSYPCTVCQRNVRNQDASVGCDQCNGWSHTVCVGISDEEYDTLIVVNVLIITMPVNGNVTLLWCHLTDKSNVTF